MVKLYVLVSLVSLVECALEHERENRNSTLDLIPCFDPGRKDSDDTAGGNCKTVKELGKCKNNSTFGCTTV